MSVITFQSTNVQDIYLDSASPTTNTNGDTHLYIGDLNIGAESTRTILKFPLDDGTIPAGSTINSATLSLFKLTDYSNNNRTAQVFRLLRVWSETQATWNVYTTGNSWSTAGADNSVTDRENSNVGTRAFVTGEGVNAFADFTLTASKVQEMISGGVFTNNGFIIRMNTEIDDGWEFASNAHATGADHPKLVVDYTAPVSSPSGLSTNKGYW